MKSLLIAFGCFLIFPIGLIMFFAKGMVYKDTSKTVSGIVLMVIGFASLFLGYNCNDLLIPDDIVEMTKTYNFTSIQKSNIGNGNIFSQHSEDYYVFQTNEGEYKVEVAKAKFVLSEENKIYVNKLADIYKIIKIEITPEMQEQLPDIVISQ